MRTLLLGATGQVGNELLDLLLADPSIERSRSSPAAPPPTPIPGALPYPTITIARPSRELREIA